MAAHNASLDIFEKVGTKAIFEKRDNITAYLEFVINEVSNSSDKADFEIITPKDPKYRGAQLSILAHGQGKALFDAMADEGVVADWREPNVIRIAPAPLYNSYEDVFRFGEILSAAIQ
jgi:kynureninase